MTIKHTAPPSYGPAEQFPERPPRNDMQNSLYRERPGHQTALIRHFGSPDSTLVLGDIPVRHTFQRSLDPLRLRYPDLMVAFNVNSAEVIARRGFAIDDQGKPPDFVLEIASLRTALNGYTIKRVDYAAFGIPEYWRFDHTEGDYYPVPLAGDRLVDGEYQPITIVQTEEGGYWGHSDALNLDLCWEHGQLRFYDPVAQRYLRTHNDEAEARIAAEADAAEAQAHIRQLEEELRRRSQ